VGENYGRKVIRMIVLRINISSTKGSMELEIGHS